MIIEGTNKAEQTQAWTVSAVLGIISIRVKQKARRTTTVSTQEQWQHDLEQKILSEIPSIKSYINPIILNTRYPSYPYRLRAVEK